MATDRDIQFGPDNRILEVAALMQQIRSIMDGVALAVEFVFAIQTLRVFSPCRAE